jgi:APA family basic amino acid/polyamine antiporter
MTWIRFGVWLLAGLVIYTVYGRRHSRLRQEARPPTPPPPSGPRLSDGRTIGAG